MTTVTIYPGPNFPALPATGVPLLRAADTFQRIVASLSPSQLGQARVAGLNAVVVTTAESFTKEDALRALTAIVEGARNGPIPPPTVARMLEILRALR